MNRIIFFVKNNASLVVMISLCVVPFCLVNLQHEKPSARNLELSAVLNKCEPGMAEFEITLKNNDQIPYVYWVTHEGAAMPSKLYKAEVAHDGIIHQAVNKVWDPLPVPMPADQIFINAGANDKLDAGADVSLAPGASTKTVIRLEGLPAGRSTVSLSVDRLATAKPIDLEVPDRQK